MKIENKTFSYFQTIHFIEESGKNTQFLFKKVFSQWGSNPDRLVIMFSAK